LLFSNRPFIFSAMDILLVAATPSETLLLRKHWHFEPLSPGLQCCQQPDQRIFLLTTGIGMVSTAYCMGQSLGSHRFDRAINLGIAGSFDRKLSLGQVVEVVEDSFPELGAESPEGWLDLQAMGFAQFEQEGKSFFNTFSNPSPSPWGLPQVKAITVNQVHGRAESIAQSQKRWPVQLESMEGAAFFHAMIRAQTPFWAFRAISNYVEPRDRSQWNIPLAVSQVQEVVIEKLR
jgi:futalosine hydrolase